ncbi:hypothetical protein WS65_13100 [Burkholderia anthina]|nr:hypothetical protein WS65_13100 [Burkholderia anthina]
MRTGSTFALNPVGSHAVRVARRRGDNLLFAVPHHPYQPSATNLSVAERERCFGTGAGMPAA